MDDIKTSKGEILIVDDTPANLQVLTKMLTEQGYKIRPAISGKLALKSIHSTQPDLILLDIRMPEMDGYEVCSRLKADENTRNIPVIFISALNDLFDKVKAFSLGALDYVTKPFQSEEVLARVETHLKLYRLQKQLTEQNQLLEQKITQCQLVETELKRNNTELKETLEKLQITQQNLSQSEAAHYAKTTFLANVSHELRTPLNSIIGFTQILTHDVHLNAQQQESVEIIQKNSHYLLTLVNDILDISQLETEHTQLHSVDFYLSRFLEDLVDLFRLRATQKGLTFIYQPLTQLPMGIRADKRRLRQILTHLLSNAIKFTKYGGINFRVRYDNRKIHFEIEDTGIGIAATDLERIFIPFEKLSDWKHKTEGAGLGLSLSKKLIELMGGTIDVTSTFSKGSIFNVELPLTETSEDLINALTHPIETIIGFQGTARHLLIVDDIEENRAILIKQLQPLGFNLLEASNGEEGLQKIQEWQPDLIITDLIMPKMDGFEFIRQLKKSPQTAHIPTIISCLEADCCENLANGCHGVLFKPFFIEKLMELLQAQLGLHWIYKKVEPPTQHDKSDHFLAFEENLSAQDASILFNLATIGDINGLLEKLQELEAHDRKLKPFVEEIRQLAKNCDGEPICKIIGHFLENKYSL